MPVFPFCSADYPTVLCLFTHHMWIGSILTVGSASHASIYMIRDYRQSTPLNIELILAHRDIIMGHLVWVSLVLGFHSFGLYIHNDTLQALGRTDDIFCDNSLQLKPLLAIYIETVSGFDMDVLDGKVIRISQELGTADLMVHHIHAFTLHVTSLILLKGFLYSRSSRLVSYKLDLGFRYACDGPGRGGTCQISSWDHVYLALFWSYNALSVVIFHFFWKMQADVWGTYDYSSECITHISAGDYSTNSCTVNGWLRNLLWSQSSQVIQSYGTSLCPYGLTFLLSHFVWSFSLMFLFSGRGYWQELIESIVWSHSKLHIIPNIRPRALSITQGRCVGVTHFVLGGISCTWS
jgi:photosystem I P700 chlorophyll a apoprotein A1